MQPRIILAFALTTLLTAAVEGQIPRKLSYQGMYCDTLGNPKPDGTYNLTFRLYEVESQGTAIWAESENVLVKKGLFHAVLGDVAALYPTVRFDRELWLSLQFSGEPELTPRVPLAAVGYSLNSLRADTAAALMNNVAVKSLNGMRNNITIAGTGGASITSRNDTIFVNATGGGGGISGAGTAGQVPFWTSASSIGGDNGLTWDNSNKHLGIGTTAPAHAVHVISDESSYGMLMLENSATGDNEATIGFKKGSDATGAGIWVAGTGPWGTAGNFVIGQGDPMFVMTAAGNVGIGTATPTTETKLHIRTRSDDFGVLVDALGGAGSQLGLHTATSKFSSLAKNAYYGSGGWQRFDVTSGASIQEFCPGGEMVFRTVSAGSNPIAWVEGMVLRTSGYVGIGTSNPASRLHVRGTTPTYVTIEAPAGYAPGINFMVGGTNQWSLLYHPVDGLMSFFREGIGTLVSIKNNGDLIATGMVQGATLKLTGGGDIAEPFDVAGGCVVEPGSVVVIDPANPGKLMLSSTPYDSRVAGIVSGAGGISPGVVMGQEMSVADGTYPVAMSGRVYCRAVTSGGPIEPGDLLTTSDVPGYAMKVTDHAKSPGATVGKAMSGLGSGRGLVLVLVNLQ